jgi:hypothetical protein
VKALLLILPGFGPEVIFEEEAAMEIWTANLNCRFECPSLLLWFLSSEGSEQACWTPQPHVPSSHLPYLNVVTLAFLFNRKRRTLLASYLSSVLVWLCSLLCSPPQLVILSVLAQDLDLLDYSRFPIVISEYSSHSIHCSHGSSHSWKLCIYLIKI